MKRAKVVRKTSHFNLYIEAGRDFLNWNYSIIILLEADAKYIFASAH